MTEIKQKLKNLRSLMLEHDIEGLRLKGVDWFSWATAGGTSAVIFTSEAGVAEVFITPQKAYVITDRIERDRLVEEEVPKEFEVVSFPWQENQAADSFISTHLKGKVCYSDRPVGRERPLPHTFQILKMTLMPEEIERYRKVGRLAAEAMTEALKKAEPNWTENQLAGEGAKSLWSRGLDPTLVMVGSEKRVQAHRHPIARNAKLGDYAMMVFCARGFGLYANLTRFVFFRPPTAKERERFEQVAKVEAAILNATKEGASFDALYGTLMQAYAEVGHPHEIDKHHQGGPTGYLSREHVVRPNSPTHFQLKTGMAVAWNPSFPGAKIEDTVLLGENGLEILTVDPQWPTFEMADLLRPEIWVKS